MAESWNTLLSNRESRNYSRLPTESPSVGHGTRHQSRQIHAVVDVMDGADYSHLQSHSLSDNEPEQPRRSSQHVHIAALGSRVSKVSLVEPPQSSPKMGKTPTEAPMSMGKSRTEALVKNPNSCWRFVERSWFQAISAVVIITNVITTIVEMDKPYTKSLFFISDQVMLCFYVVELFSRANYLGSVFLVGPWDLVCWNVLDIIVVGSGVLDQWLMPILPVETDGGTFSKVLTLLRLLRLLRVFKIVRVFLDIDLSWTEAPAFQSFIGIVIMINSVLMGVEIDIKWHGWFYFEQVLLCIYVFELSVRLKNFGCMFFSCNSGDIVWNILDFVIVTSSVLDSWITPLAGVIAKSISGVEHHKKQKGLSLGKIMMLMRMLRLMRILRLAKLIKSIQPLFILVTGVMAALQGVMWVLVLTIVTLYAMGILATSLIGKKMGFPPGADVPDKILKPFSTVPNSMFTLFRVMSGAASDAESVAIDLLMDNVPALKLCFVFFMITSSWTLLSILTAVVSDNMISTTGAQEEEIKIQNAEEDRCEHVERLTELFNIIDSGGDGRVEREEIEEFLSDRENAILTAKRCRVPVRDVREVLQTVAEACEGTTVSIATFVDHLADVSNVVTQKSVMKIEAMLTNISRQVSHEIEKLDEALRTGSKSESQFDHASQSNDEAVPKGRFQDVEGLTQKIIERTEASLNEHFKRNQRLFESMTEALEGSLSKLAADKFSEMLELQLGKMQQDLLCNMRGKEPDNRKVRDGEGPTALAAMKLASDQELSSMQKRLFLDDAAGAPVAIERDNGNGEQPPSTDKSQRDTVDMLRASDVQNGLTVAHMEAQLLAIQESIQGSQQKIESILTRIEGPLQRMSTALEGFSTLAVDNCSTSTTLESGLHSTMPQSPDISKEKGATESARRFSAPVAEIQRDLAGIARASTPAMMETFAPPMEGRLLATEKSILGLQQRAEATLGKLEGLLEKALDMGPSTFALDKFSQTLERELRMMRQELLCSLGVSKAKDELLLS